MGAALQNLARMAERRLDQFKRRITSTRHGRQNYVRASPEGLRGNNAARLMFTAITYSASISVREQGRQSRARSYKSDSLAVRLEESSLEVFNKVFD